MTKKKQVILIDGHSLAYRSYFALERTGMRNSQNEPTWAVYGFFKAFFDLINKQKPDAIAVSFDVSKHTFRNEMYTEYKAHRPPMPDDMREQVKTIRQGIETLNIPIYEQEGFEADDVIGTLTHKIASEGNEVIILTGDQDSFQLINNEHIKVLLPHKGKLNEFNREKVFEKIGVYPEQIADFKALCGDSSDNIPGVKGIGKKGASDLLNEFGTLENIYKNIDKITKKRLKTLLQEHKEMAFLSQDLAKIRTNVQLDYDFKCCSLDMPDMKGFIEFLNHMEFRTFIRQLPKMFKDFTDFDQYDFNYDNGSVTVQKVLSLNSPTKEEEIASKPATTTATIEKDDTVFNESTGQGMLSFMAQETPANPQQEGLVITTESQLEDLIITLKKKPVFAVDLETNSLKTMEANIVGIALSWQEEPTLTAKNNELKTMDNDFFCQAAYIPVGHCEGVQLSCDTVLKKLKPVLEDDKYPKVLHNAKYDMHVFLNYDIYLQNVIMDTMLASYVDDPSEKHGLKDLVYKKFKYEMIEYTQLAGIGKKQITLDKLDIETVAEYAMMDASMTLKLAHYYAGKLDEDSRHLLYTMEMPVMVILLNMERQGISLDKEYLSVFSTELQSMIEKLEEKIYAEANYQTKFNLNSPKQLGEVLFEHMGIPAGKKTKTKTGYSTSAKILENLSKDHEIARLILEYRHLSKLKSTYVDALPKLVNSKTRNIHTSFNQSVTTTGRLSSSDPNLQNIPIRTEIGNRIRKAFVPVNRENDCLLAADYSQIELRFLADISEEDNLIEAFRNNKDIHTDTACKVFDVKPEEVTKEMRRQAKAVNFGIVYGQTEFGLASTLGISRAEAREFIRKYFQTYPKVKVYMDESIRKTHETGYTITKFNRKRFFSNELKSSNRNIREFAERAAINSPLQGSAADLIKLAMIALDKALKANNLKSKMILQVHDELVLEVPKNELETIKPILKKAMEKACELSVPLLVDMSVGENWMEAK